MSGPKDAGYEDGYRQAIADAMTVNDVASQLGVTPEHVTALTNRLDLPCARKIGRYRVYWPEDVEALAHRERGPSRWDAGPQSD